MSATAKIRKKQIDTGKIINILVQGEHVAEEIIFQIEGEPSLVSSFSSLNFYLLYTRPGDDVPHILLLDGATLSDGIIYVPFVPTSYFTAVDGTVKIQLMTSESSGLTVNQDGTIDGATIWETFPEFLFVASSQLNSTETIIEENVLTKYLSGTREQALKSEGYATGKQNGVAVGSDSPYYHNNSDYYRSLAAASAGNASTSEGNALTYKNQAQGYAEAAHASAESASASAAVIEAHATAIEAIADDLENIDDVAGDLTNINTVAGSINNVDTVAGSITNVNTVAGDKTNVDTVAGAISNVNSVSANIANINAVASNATNINAVNGNKTNIDTVAGKASEITTVAGKASEITTVAGKVSEITTVAGIDSDVTAVAGKATEVGTVAGIASQVATVAGATSTIGTIVTNIEDINDVADDLAKITAVADDLTNIDAVAGDLTNIDNAEANALKAEGWANGTQNGTPVSSDSPYYENNAKYWADAVPDLKNAIDNLDHRLENIEQSKGDYIVSAYKDGSTTPSGKGKWCVVEGVEGVSRVENNLITNGNFESASGWSFAVGGSGSYSVADNIAKIIFGNNNSIFQIYRSGSYLGFSYTSGHTYLVFVKIRLSVNASVRVVQYETNNNHYGSNITVSANQWTLIPLLFTANASGQFETNVQSISGMSQGDIIEAKEFVVTDLSVYFAGDPSVNVSSLTIADIQRDYPHLLLPSDYGTRIVDWTGNGVRAVSRNLLDPAKLDALSSVTRSGDTWTATIPNWFNATKTAGWDGVKFDPATQYYVSAKLSCASDITNARIQINYTDGTFSSTTFVQGGTTAVSSGLSTAGKTVASIFFNYSSGTGNVTVSEFIINQSDAQDGTYTPWHAPNTLSFHSTTLKSAGSVRDTLELNVEVDGVAKKRTTQRIGTIVYDGSDDEDWVSSVGGRFYIALHSLIKAQNYIGYILPSRLSLVGNNLDMTDIDNCITAFKDSGTPAYPNQNWLYVRINSTITSVALLKAWLAQNPITVNYALAEDSVTLSDPIIDNTLLTEAGGRLSTVQTGTVVDGIADLGFITL